MPLACPIKVDGEQRSVFVEVHTGVGQGIPQDQFLGKDPPEFGGGLSDVGLEIG